MVATGVIMTIKVIASSQAQASRSSSDARLRLCSFLVRASDTPATGKKLERGWVEVDGDEKDERSRGGRATWLLEGD